jgi:L-lactate dehydrogenase
VTIVGAGAVGSSFAYALAGRGIAEEIVLLDSNEKLARGQALDLAHGLPFVPPVEIRCGSPRDFADSQVVVVTAGSKQKPGEPRLELLRRNAGIAVDLAAQVAASGCRGVLLLVSNPVDVLTRVALEAIGWPRGRVIGSGTVLDSARFRYLLSRHCRVDVRNVHAYILGEHGDSEFAAWSLTHIAGVPIRRYCATCRGCADPSIAQAGIEEEVRRSAYHIIGYKGATWFAVGLALVRIVEAILRDEQSVLTVSSRLDGEYGVRGVCLSVPCVVGAAGVERVVASELAPGEHAALRRSADVLDRAHRELLLAGTDWGQTTS